MAVKEDNKKTTPLTFTKVRIIKNLAVISCTFVLLFTAYDGLSMLQSTMNGKNGIGSASQAVFYTTFAVSSLLLPKYTIKRLGCKMTLFIATLTYLPYIAANAYPTWFAMMSSAVLIGIGGGILWSAQSTYFNEAAGIYCDLIEDSKKGNGRTTHLDLCAQNGVGGKMMSEYSTTEVVSGKCISPTISVTTLPTQQNIETDKCGNNVKNFNTSTAPTSNENKANIDATYSTCITEKQNMTENEKSSNNTMYINKSLPEQQQSPSSTVDSPTIVNKYFTDTKSLVNNPLAASESSTVNNVHKIEERTSPISQSLKNIINVNQNSQFCTLESVTARFFGFFGMLFYAANVSSNLISFYVLHSTNEDNVTLVTNRICGAQYCNFALELDNIEDGDSGGISSSTRYLLIGITLALSAASSLLVLTFLDPLDTIESREKVKFTLEHAMATFNHLRKKEQLFIVPLSMFLGLMQGFYIADFTKSYIECAWSISYVGLVAVSFGAAGGISSTLSGCVVKFMGRIPVVLLGLTLHLGTDSFLLVWQPDAESPYMFHLAAAVWGAQVGIFWSQIQVFYGLLFKKDEEAAFATHCFCSAVGFTMSFGYSDYFCTSVKIYILAAFSCCGVLGYLLADRSFRHRNKA